MTDSSTLPVAVKKFLQHAGLLRTPLQVVTESDVLLSGRSQRCWLAANEEMLCVLVAEEPVAEGRPVQVEARYDWTEIQEVRTVAGVGSGALQVRRDDEWLDVIRYSNTLAHRFHKVSRYLQQRVEEGSFVKLTLKSHDLDPPRCLTCQLRLSTADESCPRCLQRGQILHRVWELVAPHWKGSLALCVLTILGVAAELIPPKLQQYMVDHLLTAPRAGTVASAADVRQALLVVVLALSASRVVLSAVGVVKGRVATQIGAALTCHLRLQMVQKLQRLAIAYYDRHQVGSMISRVAHDSEVLHGLMHQLTGGFLLQTVQLVGVGAMLVWLNPKLAMFTLIPVPLVFLGTWIFWRMVYPRYYRLWDASSKQMTVLSGMLSGMRVVKAFAQEDREYDRFRTAAERLRNWRLWVEDTSSRYSAMMQLVFSLGGLIVWYVGGRDVIGQQMSLGELIAFLAYLSMFYAPLGALSNFTAWLTSFLSGSKRVLELLDTPLTIQEPAVPTPWHPVRGGIEFDQVTFGYDRNQPVLKDISFSVRPGEMVGIVGRSGSGKTTMVNLLGRFYDVQEGRILVDGIDVRQLSMQQLREHLGIVFQDSFLFRGTIWNNLSYGRPGTTIEQGLAAAKASGAHDFICRTQLGYESPLGEHGAGLSGGEKQRLSIARTLLYDPQILVLDEATSNIDAEAEKSIQEALAVLIRGRTTVAIAHRLSTLRNADRILVFDRGQLIEQGTHAELLSQDGVYAKLVRIQTQVSKDPNVDRLLEKMQGAAATEVGASADADDDWGCADAPQRTKTCVDSRGRSTVRPATRAERRPAMIDVVGGGGGSGIDDAGEGGVALLEDPLADEVPSERLGPQLVWLEPAQHVFRRRPDGQITLQTPTEHAEQVVFVSCTFPASHPREFLSVRHWQASGDDVEIGLIRDLREWSVETQAVIQDSLSRRYLVREITAIRNLKLIAGFLEFEVDTDHGPAQFLLRWTQSQVIDFADNGKLLIDTEENRYVVRDVEALSKPDRERFLQYVYW